ncbi:MAG: DUF4332 domain-containing protein [Actinomycetia bacterium]|nr:DUF4332 domain-containing protein [Actinomycetes bacterium]
MASIAKIEGIGPQYTKKLAALNIKTTEALLKKGATAKERKKIEQDAKIDHKLVLEWVNLADLFRIKGVGEEYSDLLEEAGVDTVVELSKKKVENLYEAIMKTNQKKKLVRRPPSMDMVKDWVNQAKKLKRVIEY